MSKKRKSDTDNEVTEADLNPAVENGNQTKRSKLTSPTATTLEDLPPKIHERILLDVIVSEMEDRKVHRSAWNEAADGVVERLRQVCPQWRKVLGTNLFQKRLDAFIDSCPKVEIGFKLLHKRPYDYGITATAMNNEIFVLCHEPQHGTHIRVYSCFDVLTRKRTLELPYIIVPWDLVASSVSNCLYLLNQGSRNIEIWRVYESGQQFHASYFITCPNQVVSKITVTRDGRLILYQGPVPSKVFVYKADGTKEREIEFDNSISYLHNIMTKSNNNFLFVKKNVITEHDQKGNTVNEYTNSSRDFLYGAIDEHDRIVTVSEAGSVCLLDDELNSVEFPSQLDAYPAYKKCIYRVTYNKERNEFVAFETAAFSGDEDAEQCLSVFKFTEREVAEDIKKKKKKTKK